MNEKVFKKKRFFFLSVTFFFFITMLFLYLNVSNMMYNNASILLAIKETKNLKNIILSKYKYNDDKISETKSKELESLLTRLDFYPPVIYLKLYSNEKNILYKFGRDILLESPINFNRLSTTKINYNKTMVKGENHLVYEVVIPLENENREFCGFLNILFDIQTVNNTFFNEKRILFLIVFFVNLLIIAFLIMMVLNLQKRLFSAENEIESISITDKLTGLLSKEAFIDEMKNEIDRIERNGGRLTLITADIDNFIDINNKCGYEFGDHILKSISAVFNESFRKFDFVGRFGGDEIIVLMIGATESDGYEAAENCRSFVVETKFFFENNEIPVTMSFGVAASDSVVFSDKNIENAKRNMFRNMLFNSLNALSRSKRNGKNMISVYSELLNNNQLKI